MRAVIGVLVSVAGVCLACGGAGGPEFVRLPPVDLVDSPRPADCTAADPSEWDLLLAPNAAAVVAERSSQQVVESVVLADGTELRVSRGGCDHVFETWLMSPVPAGPQMAGLRAAIERVAFNAGESSWLLPCLADADESATDGFACMEAYVMRSVDGDVLEVTWSFAL